MNGVADICNVPKSSHMFVPEGLVVAELEGLMAKVTKYCVFQLAVAVFGPFIIVAIEGEVVP